MPARSVQLIIDNQEADYFTASDLAVRVYIRSFDLSEIDKKAGSYTLNLKLPRTRNNEAILGFVGFDQPKPFAKAQGLPCKIISDGSIILSGLVFVDKVVDQYSFSGTIVGDNVGWSESVKGKRLDELQMPALAYSGARGTDNNAWPLNQPNTLSMRGVWESEDPEALGFCLPLVGYGNFPAPAGTPFADFQGIREQYALYNTVDYPLDWSRFYPAVFERSVVRSIFENAGYNVNGNYFSEADFDNTCELYTNEDNESPAWNWGLLARTAIGTTFGVVNPSTEVAFPAVVDEAYQLANVRASIFLNQLTAIETTKLLNFNISNYNHWDFFNLTTDRFFALRGGVFRFRFTGSFQLGAGLGIPDVTIRLRRNGTTDVFTETLSGNTVAFDFTTDVPMNASDFLEVYVDKIALRTLQNNSGLNLYCEQVESAGLTYGDTRDFGLTTAYYIKANLFAQPNLQTTAQTFNENYSYSATYIRTSVDLYGNRLLQTFRAPATGYYYAKFDAPNPLARSEDLTDFVAMLVVRESDDYGGDFNIGLYDPTTGDTDRRVKAIQTFTGIVDFQAFTLEARFLAQVDDTVELIFAMTTPNGVEFRAGGFLNFECYPLTDANEVLQYFPNASKEELTDNVLPYLFNPAKVLGRTDQLEYLSSILRTYNLFLFVNESQKSVTVNTREAYFFPLGQANDWSDKASLKEASASLQAKYNAVRFDLLKDGEDEALARTPVNTDVFVDVKGVFAKAETKIIEAYFAPTVNRLYQLGGNRTVILPTLSTRDELTATLQDYDEGRVVTNLKYTRRVAKWVGLVEYDYNRPLYVEDQAFTNGVNFVVPLAYFVNPNAPTSQDTLTYSNQGNLQGLYERFYQQFAELISEQVEIELPVYLTPADVATLDVRRPVRIGSTLFFVNLINGFNPTSDETTKVKLIKYQ